MAAKKHTMLYVGGAAAAAFVGYEMFYKPWKAAKDAALLAPQSSGSWYTSAGGGGSGYSLPYVTSPSVINPQGITPSNLNPGAAVGGAVGACMSKKGWTQSQCQQRLDSIVSAFNMGKTELAKLKGGSSTSEAQAALAANQAVLQQAMANMNADLKAGDQAGAERWRAAIAGHNADIANLQAAINAVPAKITAMESALAGLVSEYQALTGLVLG